MYEMIIRTDRQGNVTEAYVLDLTDQTVIDAMFVEMVAPLTDVLAEAEMIEVWYEGVSV